MPMCKQHRNWTTATKSDLEISVESWKQQVLPCPKPLEMSFSTNPSVTSSRTIILLSVHYRSHYTHISGGHLIGNYANPPYHALQHTAGCEGDHITHTCTVVADSCTNVSPLILFFANHIQREDYKLRIVCGDYPLSLIKMGKKNAEEKNNITT